MKNDHHDVHSGERAPNGHAALQRPASRAPVALAIVHHANQYLITDGYDNRPGIRAIVGSGREGCGFAHILELHRAYGVPANVNISGTLIECLAWHQPQLLHLLRQMYREGLVEFVGSAYGQNVMRFFSYEYNIRQIDEALSLYRLHLGVDPRDVRAFWAPERVWDTAAMAATLTNPALRNGGFQSVFVDDRLLLSAQGHDAPRRAYDRCRSWQSELFHAYRIARGQGLLAIPISTTLRQCVPPRSPEQQRDIEAQLGWLSTLDPAAHPGGFLAVYADDMEKAAGVGWDASGPSQFEAFLRWVSATDWVTPVKVTQWASGARVAGSRVVEGGTYVELAEQFNAGELYEGWYFDPRWSRYRDYFSWSAERVRHLASLGADSALVALAEKHLLASSWETAWHTTSGGAHGVHGADGGPSSWSCAVASHSRHAAVIAEAAFWQRHKDDESHAYRADVDNDGDDELVLKNDKLFAVISPRGGGRLVSLFAVDAVHGVSVIGNPSDDWHFKEELNDYMDVPPNHPGALADVGFEHDAYDVEVLTSDGPAVAVRLRNVQAGSAAFGLEKTIRLSSYDDGVLRVEYALPHGLSHVSVEFALSPDYMQLLRCGRSILSTFERGPTRGCRTETTAVWVRPEGGRAGGPTCRWTAPYMEQFGHGHALRLSTSERAFAVSIGVDRSAALRRDRTIELRLAPPPAKRRAPDVAAEQDVPR